MLASQCYIKQYGQQVIMQISHLFEPLGKGVGVHWQKIGWQKQWTRYWQNRQILGKMDLKDLHSNTFYMEKVQLII